MAVAVAFQMEIEGDSTASRREVHRDGHSLMGFLPVEPPNVQPGRLLTFHPDNQLVLEKKARISSEIFSKQAFITMKESSRLIVYT